MMIYLLLVKSTNKKFVGVSKHNLARVKHRFATDIRRYPTRPGTMLDDVKQAGIEQCTFVEVERCSEEDCTSRRLFWINYFGTTIPKGYNSERHNSED